MYHFMVVLTIFKSEHLLLWGQGWNCGKPDAKVVIGVAVASPCWCLALFGPLTGWEGSPTTCHSFQPLNCAVSIAET